MRSHPVSSWAICALLGLVIFASPQASTRAQNVMHIDATAPAPEPAPVAASLGTTRNPQGHVIGVNSQFLTFDGKPWLPVMGEFHFSRYPAAQWEQEILKMKAAGVGIVSTYIIWIHHEQHEGVFDWSGQRDLRRFVELCAKHGMYVYPRIGPWAHAETRNGGLPDWVMKASPVRQNNPVYLREVAAFYAQTAQQLHGLLWKDGGPVIGLQIENEYREAGAGKGVEHIRTLKKMALEDGLDVPLYTVTGWDGAAIPLDATLPVFGGYPDAPWDGSATRLPPNEVYAFRFANRSAGSMGAIGGRGQSGAQTYRGTPFLTAEVGAGIQDTYFRRPVVTADDIAAIAPVMLGSGANLLGYYMFHGGRNPDGGDITLQESQRTGYPTDVPVKSYDFQAPLGEAGQMRPSLRKLKLVHYFLEDFGAELAPMQPHAPSIVPSSPIDKAVPRVSARTLRDRGFIFFNNHIRNATDRSFAGFQVQLQTPGGLFRIPEKPIELSAGAYGIWPVNLQLGSSTTLLYSTAQLLKRVPTHAQTFFIFFAIHGVLPELMLAPGTSIVHTTGQVQQQSSAHGIRLRTPEHVTATIELAGGTTIVVMPQARAEALWRGDDPAMLFETDADAFSDGAVWTLQILGSPRFAFSIFGDHAAPTSMLSPLHKQPGTTILSTYSTSVPAVSLHVDATPAAAAGQRKPFEMAPPVSWRAASVPYAPNAADFTAAAVWNLRLTAIPHVPQLAGALLRIRYQGDVARISSGATLIDDDFWNGLPWEIALPVPGAAATSPQTLQLQILPLPRSFPMYLEKAGDLRFNADPFATLSSVELVPRYQLRVNIPSVR